MIHPIARFRGCVIGSKEVLVLHQTVSTQVQNRNPGGTFSGVDTVLVLLLYY